MISWCIPNKLNAGKYVTLIIIIAFLITIPTDSQIYQFVQQAACTIKYLSILIELRNSHLLDYKGKIFYEDGKSKVYYPKISAHKPRVKIVFVMLN
jgi:hypothetical protein